MKRIIAIIVFISLLFSFYIINAKSNIQNQISSYYIDVSKYNITSRNINNFFNNNLIIKCYPTNNLQIVDDKIENKLTSLSLNRLEEKYLKIIKDYGLYDDYDKVLLRGVQIKALSIRLSKEEKETFAIQYPLLVFST